MMLHEGDASCVCSQQRSSQNTLLDQVSEEGEEDADSSCSPISDCQHSSSSTCHSPVTELKPSRKRPTNGESGKPFFLHPRKEIDLTSLSLSCPTKTSFFLNPADQLENRKNKNLSSGHRHHHRHHHHRRHHENKQAEQHPPFYLHDPNSVVYTRVKELFGCEHEVKCPQQLAENEKSIEANRLTKSHRAGSCDYETMGTSQAESAFDSSSVRSSASLSHDDDHNNNLIPSTQTGESQVCRKCSVKLATLNWYFCCWLQGASSDSSSSSSSLSTLTSSSSSPRPKRGPKNDYEETYSVPNSNPRSVYQNLVALHGEDLSDDVSKYDESDIISIPPPPGRLISFTYTLSPEIFDNILFSEFCESPPMKVASSDSSHYRCLQGNGLAGKPNSIKNNRYAEFLGKTSFNLEPIFCPFLW